jgi:hypothetical protein
MNVGQVKVQLLIINLGTRCDDQLSHSDCFTPRTKPNYPLNRRLSLPQAQYKLPEKRKNLLALPGFKVWPVQLVS